MSSGNKPFALGAVGLLVAGVVAYMLLRSDDAPKHTASPEVTAPVAPSTGPPVEAAAAPIATAATPDAAPAASAAPVDLGMAILAAKKVDAARTALAAGDPKKALAEIEAYQALPEANPLKEEAVVLKIQALAKVGRKTDALALAMKTRDDPAYATYQSQIDAALADAGL